MPDTDAIFAIFPELKKSGRLSLYTREMALALGCTDRHVTHLIEIGKINALNIAAEDDARPTFRIPIGEYARYLAAAWHDPNAPKPTQKELF